MCGNLMLYLSFSTSQGGKMSAGRAALAAVGDMGRWSMVDGYELGTCIDEWDRKIKRNQAGLCRGRRTGQSGSVQSLQVRFARVEA